MKHFLIACLAIFIGREGFTQNLSLGPTAGFGHSWLTSRENVKFKPGVNVGATLVYSFHPSWGVGGDVRVSFLEGEKIATGSQNDISRINTTYLRIPVKLFYFFGEYGNKVRPKLYAGPAVGFLLGGNVQPYAQPEREASDAMQAFDFGFTAGTGLNYRLMKYTWLNVDLAYTNGLMDATKGTSFYRSTRNISFHLGVTFPIGTVQP